MFFFLLCVSQASAEQALDKLEKAKRDLDAASVKRESAEKQVGELHGKVRQK
jgi:hypothetical protein